MRRKLERMIEMITEVGLGGYHPASPFTRFQDLSLPLDPTFSPNFLLFFKKKKWSQHSRKASSSILFLSFFCLNYF